MNQRLRFFSILILSLSFIYIGCSDDPITTNTTLLEVRFLSNEFRAPFGGPNPDQSRFFISSSTNEILNYSFSNDSSWLQIFNSNNATHGFTPDSVFIFLRVISPRKLPHGTYYDTISITTDSTSQDTIFKEIILHIGSEISTNQNQFEFLDNVNSITQFDQSLRINSTTSIEFDVVLSENASWLNLSRTSYNTGDTSAITLLATAANLSKGTYVDTIWISSDSALNSPLAIPVTFNVIPWTSQESPWKKNINDVYFSDSLNGWAIGDIRDNQTHSGFIIKTEDGGKNWRSVLFLSEDSTALSGISFIDNKGWAVGTYGIIMNSDDYGETWAFQSAPANLIKDFKDVSFITADSGWIVGDSGIVLATSDGGANWQIQDVPRNIGNNFLIHGLTGISFVDNMHGWISGLTNIVLATSDGGETWVQQSIPTSSSNGDSYDFQEIMFVDTQQGWAVGKFGLIVSTVDGGVTWDYMQINQDLRFLSLFFIDASYGWISDQDGNLFHTTDGGNTWNPQAIETASALQSLFFINRNIGWVVGGDGAIFHTASGGE